MEELHTDSIVGVKLLHHGITITTTAKLAVRVY